jgi:hypothetical protein
MGYFLAGWIIQQLEQNPLIPDALIMTGGKTPNCDLRSGAVMRMHGRFGR